MKLWITIFVTLTLAVGISWWSTRTLEDGSGRLVETTNALLEAAKTEDWPTAISWMNQLEQEWDTERVIWQSILIHTEIEQVNLQIVRTRLALDAHDAAQVRVEAGLIIDWIDHVNDWDALRLENIL